VKKTAEDEEITLVYIPAGQTDEWQPLDRKIFGNLKARAVGRFNAQFIRNERPDISLNSALMHLVESWRSIGEDQVQEAWEHFD
jgi:hypothetical protein